MKLMILLVAVAFGFPSLTIAQAVTASGGGGSSGIGRSCGCGGGSALLKLDAVNHFPEGQLIGFAYGIIDKTDLAYLVCFQSTDSEIQVDDSAFMMQVSVKDGDGKITQTGAVNNKVVTIAYSTTLKATFKSHVDKIVIDGREFDIKKGRVFVISEIGDNNDVHQYDIKIVDSSQIEPLLKLIEQITRN